jgi:tripartite-type tricarboxylate transporter receptor subunit TctC
MKNLFKFLVFLGLSVALAIPLMARAWSPDPRTPIEIVSPFAPGGTTYTVAVLLERHLVNKGYPAWINAKPGAGGIIATNYYINTPPAGPSLLMGLGLGMLVHPPTAAEGVKKHTVADFEPITVIGKVPSMLVTRADSPYKTLADLKAERTKPLSIGFGTTTQEIFASSIAKQIGPNVVTVLYKNTGVVIKDVVAGHIDFAVATPQGAGELLATGKLVALGTTQPKTQYLEFSPDINVLGKNFGASVSVLTAKGTHKEQLDWWTEFMRDFLATNKGELEKAGMVFTPDLFGAKAFIRDMANLDKVVNK